MFSLRDILYSVVMPAAIALAVMLIGWQPWRARRAPAPAPRAAWAGAAALAAGFAAAFPAIQGGVPKFPPGEATARLFYIAIVLGIFGIGEAFMPRSIAIRALPVFIIATSVITALLRFKTQQWPTAQSIEIVAGLGALATLWWATLESASTDGGVWLGLLMIAIGAVVSAMMMLTGSLTFAKLGGALTAATAGAGLVSLWRGRGSSLARGGTLVFSTLTVCLLAGAVYLFDLKPIYAALLAGAPLLAWGAWLLPGSINANVRSLVRVTLVLIPLIIALALAGRQFQREMAEPGDPYATSSSQ